MLDHFGFNLAWGSAAWLPTIYTLQVQYLARHPVELSTLNAAVVLLTGCAGYVLFRSVNNQKDLARRTEGDCTIWGKKAQIVRVQYTTTDGRTNHSMLLCSGK